MDVALNVSHSGYSSEEDVLSNHSIRYVYAWCTQLESQMGIKMMDLF